MSAIKGIHNMTTSPGDGQTPRPDAVTRITDYLSLGGLFNPELANHNAVRDLLIDCRGDLAGAQQQLAEAEKVRLQLTEEWNNISSAHAEEFRRAEKAEAALATARREALEEITRHITANKRLTADIKNQSKLHVQAKHEFAQKRGDQLANQGRIIAELRAASEGRWLPIDTAPKDGSLILLLARDEISRVNIGKWWAEGTSWVDEFGNLDGDAYTLAKTGVWESGGGWFQPNEVSHWMPLPAIRRLGEQA